MIRFGQVAAVAAGLAALAACTHENEFTELVGGDGVLRFNLVFTNEANVDLDLHVITPLGEEIYYAALEDSSRGFLDVDCYCEECPQGPNENIFWPHSATPPPGTYQVFINYYASCALFDDASSDWTLRILHHGELQQEHSGTMDLFSPQPTFTYTIGAE